MVFWGFECRFRVFQIQLGDRVGMLEGYSFWNQILCLYLFKHVLHTDTHIYTQTHKHTNTHRHTHTHVYIYICIHTYIAYIYIHM